LHLTTEEPRQPPFDAEAKRRELRDRLVQIPGVDIPADAINKWPSFPITALVDDGHLNQFLNVLNWFLQEKRSIPE
jgi:hypothetical protein